MQRVKYYVARFRFDLSLFYLYVIEKCKQSNRLSTRLSGCDSLSHKTTLVNKSFLRVLHQYQDAPDSHLLNCRIDRFQILATKLTLHFHSCGVQLQYSGSALDCRSKGPAIEPASEVSHTKKVISLAFAVPCLV